MNVNDLVLVQGMRDTRQALENWERHGWRVVRSWLLGSIAIAAVLLSSVYVIAKISSPDLSLFSVIGVHRDGTIRDLGIFLYRNSLVLALHAMACVAGFIAGSSLPISARHRSGAWRWIHEKAGPLAIGFVVCATTFSLVTQAYILGGNVSTISNQLGITPGLLMLCYLPHAIPELIALFLPLAAWLMASRNNHWDQLLAATFVTLAISVPLLIVSVTIEVFVSPEILKLALY
jgi:Stage II sporulation protein M